MEREFDSNGGSRQTPMEKQPSLPSQPHVLSKKRALSFKFGENSAPLRSAMTLLSKPKGAVPFKWNMAPPHVRRCEARSASAGIRALAQMHEKRIEIQRSIEM